MKPRTSWVALALGALIASRSGLLGAIFGLGGVVEGQRIPAASLGGGGALAVTADLPAGTAADVRFELERSGVALPAILSTSTPRQALFTGLGPGKYFLSATLEGDPASPADVSFDILPDRPPNDDFAAATPVSGAFTSTASNLGATREPGEPPGPVNASGATLWWRWKAAASGPVTVAAWGIGFGAHLQVHAGSSLETLAPLRAGVDVAGDGRSQADFVAVAASDYYFAVDGLTLPDGSEGLGQVGLSAILSPPPALAVTSPADGAVYDVATSGDMAAVALEIQASAAAGLASVEYELGGGPATPLAPPHRAALGPLPPGEYTLVARASDAAGLRSSAVVGFTVAAAAPEMILGHGAFSHGGFTFLASGVAGVPHLLESAPALGEWSLLRRWEFFPGLEFVTDPAAMPAGARFYKLRRE